MKLSFEEECSSHPGSDLMSMPAEVRLEILRNLVRVPDTSLETSEGSTASRSTTTNFSIAILATCQTLFMEGRAVMLESTLPLYFHVPLSYENSEPTYCPTGSGCKGCISIQGFQKEVFSFRPEKDMLYLQKAMVARNIIPALNQFKKWKVMVNIRPGTYRGRYNRLVEALSKSTTGKAITIDFSPTAASPSSGMHIYTFGAWKLMRADSVTILNNPFATEVKPIEEIITGDSHVFNLLDMAEEMTSKYEDVRFMPGSTWSGWSEPSKRASLRLGFLNAVYQGDENRAVELGQALRHELEEEEKACTARSGVKEMKDLWS